MAAYPKCKYHAEALPVLVEDAKEEAALGPDWYDHPNLVKPVGYKPPKPKKLEPEPSKDLA